MWAKISTSTTTMLCAACIATAATLPVMGAAADEVAQLNADVNLKVNVANLDAFDAIPSFVGILNGIRDQDLAAIIEALGGLDSTSAIPAFVALLGGDLTALNDLDSTNGILPVISFLQTGDPDALAPLESVNAVRTFFGTDGVFTGGGLTALRPDDETGNPGYAALSALPEYRDILTGDQATREAALERLDSVSAVPSLIKLANGDLNALGGLASTDGIPLYLAAAGGDLNALRGLDLLSAIPEYLQVPEPVEEDAAPAAARLASVPEVQTPAPQTQDSSSGLVGTGNPLRSVAQRVTGVLPNRAPEAVAPEATPQVVEQTAPENSAESTQNITRESKKFSPELRGNSPILFGTGGQGVDNGIRGWGSALKKLGIGGGDAAGGGEAQGADGGE